MTISKKRMIAVAIITTLFLLAGAMLCSSKVYAAGTYSYDLSNGVTITADRNLDNLVANPDVGSADEYIHIVISGVSNGDSAELKNNTHWDGSQSWTLECDNDTIDIPIQYYGKYKLTITANGSSASRDIWIAPKRPSRITVATTNKDISFNTMSASPYSFGTYTWVNICDTNNNVVDRYKIKNQESKVSITPDGLEPGKKYVLYMWGWDPNLDTESGNFISQTCVKENIVMGPSTQPKIKSVKISKVKVSKVSGSGHWKDGVWTYNYKTSWTATVTLSKKAKNVKGIELDYGYGSVYKAKGNKTKYTIKMSIVSEGFNHKGDRMNFRVCTYSDNSCGAYSPWSAYKSVKIK